MTDDSHLTAPVNPAFIYKPSQIRDITYYSEGLQRGDRYILSQAITLLESKVESKRQLALALLAQLQESEETLRIGITGAPGVGKSTFIEALGSYLVRIGHRPAILAIDPSSSKTRGSILGDKTRMHSLSSSAAAFVRPSPSSSSLGGTADMTREAISLCEATGFNMILIETVGVGQSETEVAQMTDVNLLLLQPGAGDDIQGIKRGIMEMADIFVINKADGAQKILAEQSRQAYSLAVPFFRHELSGWQSPVLLTSAAEQTGITEVVRSLMDFIDLSKKSLVFAEKRRAQQRYWFEKEMVREIQTQAFRHQQIRKEYTALSKHLLEGNTTMFAAIRKMQTVIRQFFT